MFSGSEPILIFDFLMKFIEEAYMMAFSEGQQFQGRNSFPFHITSKEVHKSNSVPSDMGLQWVLPDDHSDVYQVRSNPSHLLDCKGKLPDHLLHRHKRECAPALHDSSRLRCWIKLYQSANFTVSTGKEDSTNG